MAMFGNGVKKLIPVVACWGALGLAVESAPFWAAVPAAVANDAIKPGSAPLPRSNPDLTIQELGKLQGTWDVVDYEFLGQKHALNELQITKMTLRISGNKFSIMVRKPDRGHILKGTVTIDPTQEPKRMDWTEIQIKQPDEAKLEDRLGIYRLDEDTLRLCSGKNRPVAFETSGKPDLDQRLYTFKRERS
jgi:uncharacterized protein (TIGR03067 family)